MLKIGSSFLDDDGDTHLGTKWTIKDNSGKTVFVTATLDKNGNYTETYDKNNLTSFIVPKGVLKYATTYKFQATFYDSRELNSDASNEFSFTTPVKPANVDDYGVPTSATSVEDKNKTVITSINAGNIGTLKDDTAIKTSVPQISVVNTVIKDGNVKDSAGNVLATINTADLKIVKSDGGVGKALVVATSDTIASIMPIDTGEKHWIQRTQQARPRQPRSAK